MQGTPHEARPGLGGSLARDKDVPPRLRPPARPPGSDADQESGNLHEWKNIVQSLDIL